MNEIRESYYRRLDKLRAAYPEIYTLVNSDTHVRNWVTKWAYSSASLEEGLADLVVLLCENKKELTGRLTTQISQSPVVFGVDLAKEKDESSRKIVEHRPFADEYSKRFRRMVNSMPIINEDLVTKGMDALNSYQKDPEPQEDDEILNERESYLIEAALEHGFTMLNDEGTIFKATQEQIVSLLKSYQDTKPQEADELENTKPQKLRDMFKLRF